MSGKGDRDRTTDREAYEKAYDSIFNEKTYNQLFKPKRPFYNDIKKYERAFNVGKNSNEGVFSGGNTDSIQEGTSEDVGANPTSSTIDSAEFHAPPIRHGIRRVIE